MRDDFDVPMRPAQLVGLDVSPWFRSVLIDRGADRRRALRDAGDHRGRPRRPRHRDLAARGRARACCCSTARARSTRIVQRSRARGIVRGRGSDGLVFEFVVRGDDVQLGDVVITSGLGGVLSEGPARSAASPRSRTRRDSCCRRRTLRARGRLRPARAGVRDAAARPDHGAALRGPRTETAAAAAAARAREAGRSRLLAARARWRSCCRAPLARFLPARFVPDLGFLLVVALGPVLAQRGRRALRRRRHRLRHRPALGLAARPARAAADGGATRLARLGNRQLSLRGALPQAFFVAVARPARNAFAMALLTSFFSPGSAVAGIALRELLAAGGRQRAVRAAAWRRVTARTVARLGDEDGGQRVLPLAPRGRIA